jgi:hypothetical protein
MEVTVLISQFLNCLKVLPQGFCNLTYYFLCLLSSLQHSPLLFLKILNII